MGKKSRRGKKAAKGGSGSSSAPKNPPAPPKSAAASSAAPSSAGKVIVATWEEAVMEKLEHRKGITDEEFKSLMYLGQTALMVEDEVIQKTIEDTKGHDGKKAAYAAAIFPRIVEAGLAHVEALSKWPEPTRQLRFKVGDRVYARASQGMEAATVIKLWYREDGWPPSWSAPYQMKLEATGALIYAPADSSVWVSDSPDENEDDAEYNRIMSLGLVGSRDRSNVRGEPSQLHAACMSRQFGDLQELLRIPNPQYDPNIDFTVDGDTPLHIAVTFGRFLCAIVLLAAGADPRISNKKGLAAVSFAASREGHKMRMSDASASRFCGSTWELDATALLIARVADHMNA